jgi:hypothetical protein
MLGAVDGGSEGGPGRAALERARDWAFRRVPARRVRGERAALAFVEEVGLCSTFYRFPEGVACLWEAVAGRRDPRWPRHSHHDAGVGLTWELKDALPARRAVYYGKLLRGRPVLVALDLFPAFYALVRGRQRARDYRAEYEAGRLSHAAKRLMDVLVRRRPLYTREWRAEALMLDPGSTRGFERAVAELQQGLFVAKTEERYDPTFSYRWDLVEAWLPDGVREGRRLGRAAALRRLVERYLAGAVWSSARAMTRLFAVPPDEVRAAVAALARAGAVRADLRVPGLPADVVVHRAAAVHVGPGVTRRRPGPASRAAAGRPA